MTESRWIDRTQPERLVQGTMMLYVTAAFNAFSGLLLAGSGLGLIFLLIAGGKVAGGYGIANEKKIGYTVATVAAGASLALSLLLLPGSPVLGLISVAISAWVLSLLLHDTSRSYQRVWFK